jgi:hypothetical protein
VQIVSSVSFLATQPSATFSFLARLVIESALGFTDISPDVKNGVVDFGNSAQLELILPAGVTFSSASGQFLQNVPEPAVTPLALLGLAALFARRRA